MEARNAMASAGAFRSSRGGGGYYHGGGGEKRTPKWGGGREGGGASCWGTRCVGFRRRKEEEVSD